MRFKSSEAQQGHDISASINAGRMASVNVDLRAALEAGLVLAQLSSEYCDGKTWHAMARTASYGLVQNRVLEAMSRLAALSDSSYEALRDQAIRAFMSVAKAKDEESAKAIFDSQKVQSALYAWAYKSSFRLVNNLLSKVGKFDAEDASDMAVGVVTRVFNMVDDDGRPTVFRIIRGTDLSRVSSTTVLKPLENYIHMASRTDVQKSNAKNHSVVGDGSFTSSDGETVGMEDTVKDESVSPETAAISAAGGEKESGEKNGNACDINFCGMVDDQQFDLHPL